MPNTFELIASSTVGAGGASSIDFTSIPSTYTDLCVLFSLRSDTASAADNAEITFNASTSTFSLKRLYGSGSAAASDSPTYTTSAFINGDGATANSFGNGILYIPNYAGSTNKSYSIDAINETNATTAYAGLYAGLWATTSAISSIKLKPNGGTNFKQYSTAYLYGVKNA